MVWLGSSSEAVSIFLDADNHIHLYEEPFQTFDAYTHESRDLGLMWRWWCIDEDCVYFHLTLLSNSISFTSILILFFFLLLLFLKSSFQNTLIILTKSSVLTSLSSINTFLSTQPLSSLYWLIFVLDTWNQMICFRLVNIFFKYHLSLLSINLYNMMRRRDWTEHLFSLQSLAW